MKQTYKYEKPYKETQRTKMLKVALLILQSFQVVIPRVVKFVGGNINRNIMLKKL